MEFEGCAPFDEDDFFGASLAENDAVASAPWPAWAEGDDWLHAPLTDAFSVTEPTDEWYSVNPPEGAMEVDRPVDLAAASVKADPDPPQLQPEDLVPEPETPDLSAKQHLGRGQHVRDRPDLSANARMGQIYWKDKAAQIRMDWNQANIAAYNPAFSRQLDMRHRTNTKAKLESLLLTLQTCAANEIIDPLPFSEDARQSFLGWTGFAVQPGCGPEFRRRILSIFPDPDNTCSKRLNTLLRDARLVPNHSWQDAWNGRCQFVYNVNSETRRAPS